MFGAAEKERFNPPDIGRSNPLARLFKERPPGRSGTSKCKKSFEISSIKRLGSEVTKLPQINREVAYERVHVSLALVTAT